MRTLILFIVSISILLGCQMGPSTVIIVNQLDHRAFVASYLWFTVVQAKATVVLSLPDGIRSVLTASDEYGGSWGPFDVYVPAGSSIVWRISTDHGGPK